MLTFNNRRMLHGREAFVSQGNGTRHLVGTYVNIDEYLCKLHVVQTQAAQKKVQQPAYRVGNQDWS